ncbi:MAG: outer membrane protein [Gemmatimonadaceae bacterium]
MKRIMLFLAALVVAVALSSGSIQAQGLSFHLGGGIAMGAGDLSDNTETGWMGFAGLDTPIASLPGLGIGATASYAHIPYEGELDDATNISALLAELSYLIGATSSSPFKPYVRGGIGAVQHKYDSDYSNGDSDSETKVGFGAGAGILYAMRQVSPFIGAHFISSGSETSYYTVYAGISIGGGGGTAAAVRRAIGR